MSSLEMSLCLRIRSNVNWVQDNAINRQTLLSMSSYDHMIPIKFTETIHNIPKIHVSFKTYPIQELSICSCKVKGNLNANFAKSKNEIILLHFCK